jgi:hypothetical protein
MCESSLSRGSKYRFEADPLVLDGVLYIPTGNDDIFALDAKAGKQDLGILLGHSASQRSDLLRLDNCGVGADEGKIY